MDKEKNSGDILMDELRQLATITEGSNMGDFYRYRLESAKVVKIVPCREVLTKDQISLIKKVIKPKKKECYKNALMMAKMMDCTYCEGMMYCYYGIDHAFNKVGDKYIDITKEFALGEDPTAEYVVFGEYTPEDAHNAMVEKGCYGNVFGWLYAKAKRTESKITTK